MNLIIQTCVPSYRLGFYKCLVDGNKTIQIISGDDFYTSSVKSDKTTPGVLWIKNIFILNRIFLFQMLPWIKVFKAENVIIEFNLRNISFYLVFFIRFFLNKKTFLWGHAWSRKGRKSKSELLRFLFKKLSDGYIAYTQEQKNELKTQLPNKAIYAACNAIYYKKQMWPLEVLDKNITDFIYVGRLVIEKKVFLLIKAFHNILNELPEETKLFVVGTGNEHAKIKEYIEVNNLTKKVLLLGHISDYKQLKELYSTAIASISPGYVGLSLTQSLGFGVPMIISRDERHSPELEAATIKFNSVYFKTDDLNNLAATLKLIYLERIQWLKKRNKISEDCRNRYSIESMTEPFFKIFKLNE